MMKNHFTNALKGILIGLILSILFSFLNSPSTYTPLSPSSAVGQWMQAHEIHGALVMLYCLLIWASIGLLFSFGTVLFAKDWSLLRATLSHYLLMLFGFLPLATLGGWFPVQISFYISVIIEFSLVYLVIWAASYHIYKKKVEEINQQLQGKA